MKRLFLLSVVLLLAGNTFFTSCSSEEEAQMSLTDQLMNDQDFSDAATATVDFLITAVSNNWLENLARVKAIIGETPAADLSEQQWNEINDLLGMDMEEYLREVETFALSVGNLYFKYPQLGEMSVADRNAIFTEVLASNAMSGYLAEMQDNARGPFDWVFCYLQDACYSNIEWLIPTIQELLGTACDFITGVELPIPFLDSVEEAVCVTLPGYVESFLPGICEWIPCEP